MTMTVHVPAQPPRGRRMTRSAGGRTFRAGVAAGAADRPVTACPYEPAIGQGQIDAKAGTSRSSQEDAKVERFLAACWLRGWNIGRGATTRG